MPSIDNRVVRMDFDNKKFEQDVKTTTTSLDRLKNSLKFEGATDGLKNIGQAIKDVTFDPITASIERVRQNVSVASVAIIASIMNITNRVVNAGIQMGKSLTVAPLMDGFKEYETNMGAIQTVLANTSKAGTTLDDVNAALDELNVYSDKTIYNFGEMAKNIGTFTAAGVDLKTSVSSIKGIANVAAMSGSTSEQASTAMYQLSQAVSSGTVKLQDWISVRNASMGGRVFQEALFNTGKALGTIENANINTTFDEWTASGTDFAHSLEQGWLTSEVLTKTLSAFTGDLNEEQLIGLGYTKDQAAEFMVLAKNASNAATVVKTFGQLAETVKSNIGSGWSSSFRIVIGDFEEAKTLFTAMNNAVNNIVGPMTDARNAMLQAWKMFGGRTVLLQGLIYAFQAIASVVKSVSMAFRDVFPKKSLPELLQLTKKFKDFTLSLKPNEETLKNIRSVARGVFSVFSIAITIVTSLAKVVWNLSKAIGGSSKVLPILAKIGDFLFYLKQGVDQGVVGFLAKLGDSLSGIASNAITTALDFIQNIFGRIGGRASQAGEGVSKLGSIFGWLGEQISKIPDILKKTFSKENFNTSIDILNVGIFASLVGVLAHFFKRILAFDFGSGFIKKLTGMFEELGKTLAAFQLKVKADAIRSIAISIAIMAGSLLILSMIDSEALQKALVAMALVFGLMAGMMKFLESIAKDKGQATAILKTSIAMAAIGVSMMFLAGSLKVFASMSWAELAKGFTGLILSIGTLVLALKYMPEKTKLFSTGLGIYFMAKGAKKFADAVQTFGRMSLKELTQGLLSLSIVMTLLIGVIEASDQKKMLQFGAGIFIFAYGIMELVGAIWLMGKMDTHTLIQGLFGLTVILVGLSVALQAFPQDMDKIGIGMLAIGAAIGIITAAILVIGSMGLGNLIQGLVGIAAVLTILAVAVKVLDTAIVGVEAIVQLAGALMVMAIAIKVFGSMSLGDLIKGLIGMAGAIGVVALASLAALPALPAIIGLAVAFGILGIAIAAIGIGAMLLAKAIDMIVKSGANGVSAIGGLLGSVISKIGEFVGALFTAFMGIVKKFFVMLPELFKKLLGIITGFIPGIITFVLNFVVAILNAIRQNLPELVSAVIEIIATFINTIAANLGLIIAAGTNLIVAWIRGMDNASQLVIDAVTDLIVNFLTSLKDSASRIIEAGRKLIVAVIEGMDKAITDPNDGIVPAIRTMIVHFINAVADSYGDIIDAGVKAVVKFLDGLGKNAQEISDAAGKFILDVLTALEKSIETYAPQIRNAAIKIGLAIIDGMTFGLGTKVLKFMGLIDDTGAKAIDAARASVDAHSPSRAFMEIGKDMMDGLTIGIARDSSVVNATRRVGSDAVKALNSSLSLLAYNLGDVSEFNPTITPVLDLSNIQNGSKLMNNMFGSPIIGANLSFGKASAISVAENQNQKNTAVKISPQVNEIKFEQTINSPVALTTSEIYRNTKTQISMAKEELRLV